MDRTADTIFDTSPPDMPVPTLKRRVAAKLSAALMPMMKRAARPYLGGDTIDDALCVAEHLRQTGMAATLGYWDTGTDSLAQVYDVYRSAIAALPPGGDYLSLKPPALRFSSDAACALAADAAAKNLRLHLDSHGPDVAQHSRTTIAAMLGTLPPSLLGNTLAGRWSRSLADADWATEAGIPVRVVKGQWPDPSDPARDPSQGFLEVIDRLAGRTAKVAVATHDAALGRECIGRLRAAGTPCELEVLLGYPAKPLLAWAKDEGVPVRVYVPYGPGFIPNAVGVLRRNPRLVFKVAQSQIDRLRALLGPRT